jgi:RNA polymerase sigma factor (sigma-70 family)
VRYLGVSVTFVEFYERSRDPCLRAMMASGVARASAEDALAEAFARAYSRWDQLSTHPALRAWIMKTALNARTSTWRRSRRELLTDTLPDSASHRDMEVRDPALVALLTRLPRRQREVVALRILLDLDTADTASVLGISHNTVGVHLHRALNTLRERLVAAGHEESAP